MAIRETIATHLPKREAPPSAAVPPADPAAAPAPDPEPAAPSLERAIRRGTLVAGIALGGALLWACLARLDSAAIALGTVVVDVGRQTVQHLEGGIVAEILVREGARVARGDVLVRLDPTRSQSALSELSGEALVLAARRTRLEAERDGAAAVSFTGTLEARAGDPAVARVLASQRELFETRRRAHEGELAALRGRAQQASREIEAQRALERATTEQLAFAGRELAAVQELFDKGLERLPRLMQVKRFIAETQGRREAARTRAIQAEQELQVAELEAEAKVRARAAEASRELESTEARISEVAAKLQSARDEVARTEVRAPLDGAVVDLRVHTVGGVIAPGAPIMDIVPGGGSLAVDARVAPADIDVVHPGQQARVRLTAFSRSRTPMVEGEVESVSADRLTDARTGEAYYLARVRLADTALERLDGATLVPGMAAEALISVGSRPAISYLLRPITDSFTRAMVED